MLRLCLTLALLVAQVLADHHDPTVAADHLALVADLLDARLDLHLPTVCKSGSTKVERAGGGASAVAEDDAAAGQVIGAELNNDTVLREDPDVVLAHLARDVCEHLVTVGQLNPEHRVRERLHDRALDLDDTVLLGHVLHNLLQRGRSW